MKSLSTNLVLLMIMTWVTTQVHADDKTTPGSTATSAVTPAAPAATTPTAAPDDKAKVDATAGGVAKKTDAKKADATDAKTTPTKEEKKAPPVTVERKALPPARAGQAAPAATPTGKTLATEIHPKTKQEPPKTPPHFEVSQIKSIAVVKAKAAKATDQRLNKYIDAWLKIHPEDAAAKTERAYQFRARITLWQQYYDAGNIDLVWVPLDENGAWVGDGDEEAMVVVNCNGLCGTPEYHASGVLPHLPVANTRLPVPGAAPAVVTIRTEVVPAAAPDVVTTTSSATVAEQLPDVFANQNSNNQVIGPSFNNGSNFFNPGGNQFFNQGGGNQFGFNPSVFGQPNFGAANQFGFNPLMTNQGGISPYVLQALRAQQQQQQMINPFAQYSMFRPIAPGGGGYPFAQQTPYYGGGLTPGWGGGGAYAPYSIGLSGFGGSPTYASYIGGGGSLGGGAPPAYAPFLGSGSLIGGSSLLGGSAGVSTLGRSPAPAVAPYAANQLRR